MKRISFFKILTSLSLLVTLAACGPGKKEDSAEVAQDKNEENLGTRDDEKDAELIVKAVEGNYAEIKLAQLASSKSMDAGLKDIAILFEKDEAKTLEELKDLSYKKGFAIPVEENKDAKDDIRDLAKEEQADFNKDWLAKLTTMHERTIKEFETAWEETQDAELRSWINHALPALRTHLDKLKAYKSKMK